MRQVKSSNLAAIVIIEGVVAVGVLAVWARPSPKPVGQIIAVRPSVTVQYGTEVSTANVNEAVYLREMVRTNESGRVRIRMNDQSMISLGTASEIRIHHLDASTQQTNIQITYGLIRMQIAHITATGGKFELKTPVAVAGVIGTDFGADASDVNVTKFVCIGGTVEIRNADPTVQGTVLCHGGESTQVRAGQPPDPPIPITEAQTLRWQHITDPDEK